MSLGLYLHIPFCSSICNYCNFNRGLFDAALKDRYVAALEREIRSAGDGSPVDTIFFGGGTPSLLEPSEIGRLIAACRERFVVEAGGEITLETNPENSSEVRMAGFRESGVLAAGEREPRLVEVGASVSKLGGRRMKFLRTAAIALAPPSSNVRNATGTRVACARASSVAASTRAPRRSAGTARGSGRPAAARSRSARAGRSGSAASRAFR